MATVPKICKVHGTELKRMSVPIHYGMPAWDPAWDVQPELFPNAHSYTLGGCVIGPGSKKTETYDVCLECRAAEKEWKAQNPDW